ncbi:hypothetical protein SAMN05421678_12823 [Actinopolymorpha cephalotaxi]|uniref:Integrase core domain-containing protein n=1 Tax=Actinopolymorpha cephalotaxi TaxID=504797 RepID=A0A1I3C2J9_9ACTN|nr:hypothetical protein [Actinopolymorpha cephalotaxi]SFH68221.1 hypothetical protein SAMN05421678_12823 [Actinopolymorpha cephalotaxi]
MVFTTRLSGGKGRNGLETELRKLGVAQKNSRPNHPTTCGKVERFQQTTKKWLRAQPAQPATITETHRPATRPQTKTAPNPMRVRGHSDLLRDHTGAPGRIRTSDNPD